MNITEKLIKKNNFEKELQVLEKGRLAKVRSGQHAEKYKIVRLQAMIAYMDTGFKKNHLQLWQTDYWNE